MNKLRFVARGLLAAAVLAAAVGCATSHPEREKVAIAAGFKIVAPTTPEQKALYNKLAKDTITAVKYKGGVYYMLRDSSNGMVLVGNPAQYSVYQEMRYRQRIQNEDVREAEDNELNNADWAAWGGGGAVFVGGIAP